MSSINTNAGAMTALQTLKATNKNLETTQGRISTGARVSEAAHNAAYWSIATTMRSDNNAMSTVKDALGLGAAQVDIAYTAMDAVKDTLDTMKTKLVAAQQPDIDKEKIQEEIAQLQNDLQTYAKSANFSGGNWLDVDKQATQKVVASFTRDADDNIALETINVDTSKTALFTKDPAAKGLLQSGMTQTKTLNAAVLPGTTPTNVTPGTIAAAHTITGLETANAFAEGDTLSFDVAVNGGSAVTVTVTAGASGAFDQTAFEDALESAGVTGLTVGYATGTLTLTKGTDAASQVGDSVLISNLRGTEIDEDTTVTNFSITDASAANLALYMQDIDDMLGKVTTAASDLGAIKTRIGSQQDFVGKIMDAVDRGVGQLVDADMEQESSRLQALQVQQQLGIQALSIANSNTQNILSLFR
ncbi:flagellin N-terminal helical domain-containing protein [Aquamicrobium zhengzhouense]|uniref:Flagellin n=1 Tax=Aquamicrobium zhengzhouense TaxID=2781738 RepID=A0ABS0SCE6_9HYPH|nr:flagellin [Aquamicrobium zhengzhouense]MBI1620381.1 flagellin C [Aquamicrobium zhengzhouense]